MPEVKTLSPEDEIIALRTRLKLADDLAMAAHRLIKVWLNGIIEVELFNVPSHMQQLDAAYKRYLGKVEL